MATEIEMNLLDREWHQKKSTLLQFWNIHEVIELNSAVFFFFCPACGHSTKTPIYFKICN